LNLLEQASAEEWVILELSSFQLIDLKKSSHLAVVLMVTSEHLDYHADLQEYVQAKQAITKFQSFEDFAIVNVDFENSRQIGELGSAKKYFVSTLGKDVKDGIIADRQSGKVVFWENGESQEFLNASEILLPGWHNIQNICAASMAATAASR